MPAHILTGVDLWTLQCLGIVVRLVIGSNGCSNHIQALAPLLREDLCNRWPVRHWWQRTRRVGPIPSCHLKIAYHQPVCCSFLPGLGQLCALWTHRGLYAGLARGAHHKPHHMPFANKVAYTPYQRSGMAARLPTAADHEAPRSNVRIPVTYPSQQWSGAELTEEEERERMLSMVRSKLAPSIDTNKVRIVCGHCACACAR